MEDRSLNVNSALLNQQNMCAYDQQNHTDWYSDILRYRNHIQTFKRYRNKFFKVNRDIKFVLLFIQQQDIEKTSYSQLGTIYSNIKNQEIVFDSYSKLVFNLDNYKSRELLKILSRHRLPLVSEFAIENTEQCEEIVKTFLINSIPIWLEKFQFSLNHMCLLEWTKYFHYLRCVAARTPIKFIIWDAIISHNEFWSFIKSSKKSKFVGFISWTIFTNSSWDFGTMEESLIETLSLNWSGSTLYSNWKLYPNRLLNIISGISKWDWLLQNMIRLQLYFCNIELINNSQALYDYIPDFISIEY